MSARAIFSAGVGQQSESISNQAFDLNFDRIKAMSLEISSQNFAPEVAPSAAPRAII